MADLINLRSIRKARKRAETVAKAVENRVRHGRTPAQRAAEAQEAAAAAHRLDQLKRDDRG